MSLTRRPVLLLTALALAGALGALPALAPAGQNTVQLSAKLKGNQEVPGPGDRNGKGEGFFSVKPKKHKVCFQVSWEKIEQPSAGHIHKGAEGVAGDIKVLLFDQEPPTSTVEDCAKDVKKKLLKRIAKSPEKFYVNLHNGEYPDGAIRGQLRLAQ
jgi:CHRD domain